MTIDVGYVVLILGVMALIAVVLIATIAKLTFDIWKTYRR